MWFWLCCGSALLNLLLFFYVRWLLKTLAAINEDVENITLLLNNFSDHTESIYEMEMFYGDDTLEGLMRHSKELANKLKDLDLVLNQESPDDLLLEEKID